MTLKQRIIFIGDVHGCLNELQGLLNKVRFDPASDRCIIVGDLVDRGPYSVDTVKWCKGNNIEVVLGNHDDKYVRYHQHALLEQETGKKNPMSLGINKEIIYNGLVETGLLGWLAELPTYINIPEINTCVVHAGVLPTSPQIKASEHPRRTHLYMRFVEPTTAKMLALDVEHEQPKGSVHWTEIYNGKENIIYGHHAHSFTNPHVTLHESNIRTIGIDTGCCFGGTLTALLIEQGEDENFVGRSVSINAYKVYTALKK